MTTKTNFPTQLAAIQLARTLLEQGVTSWIPALGTPINITYAFASSATQADFPLQPASVMSGFSRYSSEQIMAAETALQLWSDVANIKYTRVGTGTTGEAAYSNSANLLFANYTTGSAAGGGTGYGSWSPPASGAGSMTVWTDGTVESSLHPQLTNSGLHLLVHEIGHTLTLAHPGDYDITKGTATYENNAVYVQDTAQYTVMSYFGEDKTGGNFNGLAPVTPMIHDIAAVQMLYGANMTTRTGNTIYGFNSNTGSSIYTIGSASESRVFAIWDAGGIDTLDLSGYSTHQVIDLRPEAFSNAGSLIKNISIAANVIIENAKGGSENDTIVGNDANNKFTGGPGNDSIDGGAGTNTSVYSGARSSYSVTAAAEGATRVKDLRPGSPDGTDLLKNIQVLQFSDGTHLAGPGLTVSQEIVGLYVTLYGLASTQAGINYWTNQLSKFDTSITLGNAGSTAISVADQIYLGQQMTAGSPVVNGTTYFQTLYPSSMTDLAYVQALYQNMSGFKGTADGGQYWFNVLKQTEAANGGNVTLARQAIVGQFTHDFFGNDLTAGATALGVSASDYALLVAGQQTLRNKATVGQYWATEIGVPGGNILNFTSVTDASFAAAKRVLLGITSDPDTVTVATTGITNAVTLHDLLQIT